jgi:hypothetical protein
MASFTMELWNGISISPIKVQAQADGKLIDISKWKHLFKMIPSLEPLHTQLLLRLELCLADAQQPSTMIPASHIFVKP